jgi:hypothetical protein
MVSTGGGGTVTTTLKLQAAVALVTKAVQFTVLVPTAKGPGAGVLQVRVTGPDPQ